MVVMIIIGFVFRVVVCVVFRYCVIAGGVVCIIVVICGVVYNFKECIVVTAVIICIFFKYDTNVLAAIFGIVILQGVASVMFCFYIELIVCYFDYNLTVI